MDSFFNPVLFLKKKNSAADSESEIIPKRLIPSFALLTLLIIARAFSSVFCYVILAVGGLLLVFFTLEESFSVLVFLLPFSMVLKLSEDAMSFFTFLFFGLFLRIFLFNNRFDIVSFIAFVLFGGYSLVFSGLGQLTTIITILAGLILVKQMDRCSFRAQTVVVSFSLGLCVSSAVALFRERLPQINRFLMTALLKVDEGEYADRFAGLEGNPNYYTVGVIFAIACLAVIILNEKPRAHLYILIGILTVFGMMSVSKSFLLSYSVLLVLWFLFTVKTGGASNAFKFALAAAALVGVVFIFAPESIQLFLVRFTKDSEGTLNSISTGRYGIWQTYLNEIFHNRRILFFGNGLNSISSLGRGTHNTYFEAIYSLGLVGSGLLIFALKKIFEGIPKKSLLLMPAAVLLVRMLGIGILTYDNFWIYLIIPQGTFAGPQTRIEQGGLR